MKKIFNYTLKTVLPIILGVLILYVVYADDGFDFSQIWGEMKEMNIFWFVLSTFFGVMSHVIRGWRWKLSLAPLGYNPSSEVCVNSVYVAYAANLVLPRVGEVSRCVILEKQERVPFAHALGTLVMERMLDTLMVLMITLVAVALQWQVFGEFINGVGVELPGGDTLSSPRGLIVLLLSLVAVLILSFLFIRKLTIWKKIKSFIGRFMEGLLSLKRMKQGWLFVLETFGIWFCYFMQFYLCFFCFDFSSDLSLAAGMLLFVGGSIAVVVPTPNGLGPWHYVIIHLMILYGVPETDAMIFALIVHGTQTLLVAVLGIYGIAALNLRRIRQREMTKE